MCLTSLSEQKTWRRTWTAMWRLLSKRTLVCGSLEWGTRSSKACRTPGPLGGGQPLLTWWPSWMHTSRSMWCGKEEVLSYTSLHETFLDLWQQDTVLNRRTGLFKTHIITWLHITTPTSLSIVIKLNGCPGCLIPQLLSTELVGWVMVFLRNTFIIHQSYHSIAVWATLGQSGLLGFAKRLAKREEWVPLRQELPLVLFL